MLTEADICRTYVAPRLHAAGWTDNQIAEQRTFTDGRIFVTNGVAKRGKPKRADYLLYYQPSYPLAVVEAKAAYRSPADGVQQAKDYAMTLGLLFAYATNGQGIIEIDLHAGTERAVDAFPSPASLWARYRAAKGLPEELENRLLIPNQTSNSHPPRYYQQIAINRTVEAVLRGKRRVLLNLATGAGKTVIASQIAWKLWRGEWNARGVAGRKPRIRFLADRHVLVDDPKDKTSAPFGDARYRIGGGQLVTSRELYFSTYQAFYGDVTRPPRLRELASDFFDLLTHDDVPLNDQEREQVKRVARDLLTTLKGETLTLDWKKRQQTRARVRLAVESALDAGFPSAYTPEEYQHACDAVYQHLYDVYLDGNHSIYAQAS